MPGQPMSKFNLRAEDQETLQAYIARLTQAPGLPEERLQRIALMEARLKEIKRPQPAIKPQNNFFEFFSTCVFTQDEARGGRVAPAPAGDWPFLRELCDYLVTEKKTFIEKSRRVFASWTVCAFDVWLMAGGQDPRWKGLATDEYPDGEPVLMYNTGFRKVFLCAQNFDDADTFLKERIWFIIQQFEERGLRKLWPEFPHCTIKEGHIVASNGSRIQAVAQGANQLRGPGATFVHLEELAFWELAQQTVEGLLPIVRGGGHVCGVTTPQVGSYAKELRDGTLKSRGLLV